MNVDITQMLIIFDELVIPPTNEEIGEYWFRKNRADGFIVTVYFSIYEEKVGVLVSNNSELAIASVDMKSCSQINVLDEQKKCLEIIHNDSSGRCFISLESNNILTYEE